MAPVKNTRKRKSSTSNATKSPVRTPDRSPIKKQAMITQRQKQALIDNLQLEITERARKLRAQYALQAQSLRTRVELRVNRIPTALRKANMGELLQKYVESQRRDQEPPRGKTVAKKTLVREDGPELKRLDRPAPPSKSRGVKRNSGEMLGADKENTPDPSIAAPMPKKRAKGETNPSTVLSPKSSNSRTRPQSPARPPFGSPGKSRVLSRPQSPLKPPSPIKAAAAAATASLANMVTGKGSKAGASAAGGAGTGTTRKTSKQTTAPKPAVTRAKRGAATTNTSASDKRMASDSSNVSGSSTATTIVKRVGKALVASTAGKKAPAAASKAATQKKAAPSKAKAEAAKIEAPATGRRTLRKRA
ncbi:hypothetical protein MMC10_000687 [Thelotrema lepadinum]|nr:hypothetical protein [Thelotrema lepadinum]